jgi:hypothetical protein
MDAEISEYAAAERFILMNRHLVKEIFVDEILIRVNWHNH